MRSDTLARSSITRTRPLSPLSAAAIAKRIADAHVLRAQGRERATRRARFFSRMRLRTRAMSATSSIGFVRKSSAPASSPATRSAGWSSAVTMTTGIWAVSGSPLMRLQTSSPSICGIITSRSTMSHSFACTIARPAGPFSRRLDVEIFGGELGFEKLDVRWLVIDDENACGHDGCSSSPERSDASVTRHRPSRSQGILRRRSASTDRLRTRLLESAPRRLSWRRR